MNRLKSFCKSPAGASIFISMIAMAFVVAVVSSYDVDASVECGMVDVTVENYTGVYHAEFQRCEYGN